MQQSRILISIAFGDAILPIINCDDGLQRVPLKPIVEQVGAQWETQRRKIKPDSYLWKRLGAEITVLKQGEIGQKRGNPTYLCIRVDRVTAFLNSLNTENIRGMGNDKAADWLEAKHEEWDNALHAYETNGFAAKDSTETNRKYIHLYRLDKIKNNELKRVYADQVNKDYGLDIPLGNQGSLDV